MSRLRLRCGKWTGKGHIEEQKNRLLLERRKDELHVRDWRREWSYTFLKTNETEKVWREENKIRYEKKSQSVCENIENKDSFITEPTAWALPVLVTFSSRGQEASMSTSRSSNVKTSKTCFWKNRLLTNKDFFQVCSTPYTVQTSIMSTNSSCVLICSFFAMFHKKFRSVREDATLQSRDVTRSEQEVCVCCRKTVMWPEMLLLCSLATELYGYGLPLIRFPAH